MRLRITIFLPALAFFYVWGGGAAIPQQPASPPPTKVRFTDVARQAGVTVLNISGGPRKDYLLESVGSGAAWFDYDNDGLLDLLVVNGSTVENLKSGGDPMLALYRNNGDGTFADVTARSGLAKKGWGMGVCVADYDNNGSEDFYLTAYGPNTLFRNNGDGTFTDVSAKAGVGNKGWNTGCAFGDYDRDGFVDLYVARYVGTPLEKMPKASSGSFCQYMGMDTFCGPRGLQSEPDILYHSNRDGTFTDVTEKAGIRDPGGFGFQPVFADFDDDGWPDIYVANDSTPNFLFWNNHDGTFTEGALEAGVALSEDGHAQSGMGVSIGDYNNDGKFGIFVTNFSQDYNTLYQNTGKRNFFDVTRRAGLVAAQLGDMGWGAGFVDADNDGWLDIFLANGHIYPGVDQYDFGSRYLERKKLYQNQRNGRFREVTDEIGGGLLLEKVARGAAFGDFDNDGNVDVAIINLNDRPTLLRAENSAKNHWISLRLIGTKSNRDSIGARLRLQAGAVAQTAEVLSGSSFLSHNDFRQHFGLGPETVVAKLEIRWPSGLVEKFEKLAADQFYVITEGQGVAKAKDPAITRKR